MPHLNNYTIMGHVGRDPSLKDVNGKQVAEFSVAVSTGTVAAPETMWVKCTVWGERASRVAEKVTKGCAVHVSGRLKIRAYAGKDGTPKAEPSVFVNDWQVVCGPKQAAEKEDLDSIPF